MRAARAARQVEASGAVLHDSLRAFMRGHSQGALKRHAWSPAGGAAALTAWTGGSALLKVRPATAVPGWRLRAHVLAVATHARTADDDALTILLFMRARLPRCTRLPATCRTCC